MGDFRTQFVEKTIPGTGGVGSTNTVTSQAPADFTAVDDQSKACLIPSCTLNTAGIGFTTGTFNNGLLMVTANAGLDDSDTITWVNGYQAAIGRTDLCGGQILEYTGPGNGVNEIVVRGDLTISLAGGVLTADSAVIPGIGSINKCVPFGFAFSDGNTTEYRAHFAKWDLVDTGSGIVVRVNRSLGTGTMVVRVKVVEFVGSNWSLQKVTHTFAASATNEDATISAVTLANSFTYSTFQPTGSVTQAEENFFVWLANTTTLRHRVVTKSASGQQCVTWVISNPQLDVKTYGTIDGTADYTAVGGNPETNNVTITAIPDINQALVLGYAGSNSTGFASVVSAWWMLDITTTTNVRMRRTGSGTAANRGDTEYFIQVIDFSGVASTRIDSVSGALQDGQTFTINGLFSPGSTVTHGGDTVAVSGQTTSTISCTASIGTKTYGDAYPLTVTDTSGGTSTINVPIAPAAGTNYANLSGNPANPDTRLTSTPDLTGVEQVRWSAADVTGTAMTEDDVEVLVNGVIRYHPAVTSAAFSVNARDGLGWGESGVQTFQQAVLIPPTLNDPVPDFEVIVTTSVQINVAQYGSGWATCDVTGTLPTGLTETDGIISGAPTETGVFPLTVTYTNTDGSTQDNFILTVLDLPTSIGIRIETQFLNDATAVPADAVFKGGEAFNRVTGAKYVANYPGNGKVVYQRGLAYRPDGAQIITTGGVRAASPRGLSVTSLGELMTTENDPTGAISGGIPVDGQGNVTVTNTN